MHIKVFVEITITHLQIFLLVEGIHAKKIRFLKLLIGFQVEAGIFFLNIYL